MKNTAILFAALYLLPGVIAQAADQKPNVLLIYTDDHGWADLALQGVNKDVHTPNLDQLTRDGVRFTRGYVTAPQCTPSRAGVITGTYQQRFGVEHNNLPMRQEVVTFPERLKQVGYITGISGKWHLDIEAGPGPGPRRHRFLPELLPHHQGFDEYFTGVMQDYTASHALDGTPFADAPHKVREEGCRVLIQTEAALSFLKRREAAPGQPWFLYLAYMAPHVPLESPEPWFSQTPKGLPLMRRQALALIGAIDDGIGRVRKQLRAMGQEKETLIFVISDNGAPLGNAWDGSINLPMRGEKGMLSEGGIRVPFVAAWPGHIPAGKVYDQPVISLDVAATALSAAGWHEDAARDETAAGTKVNQLDGVNLLPFLTGKQDDAPHETLYWRWMSQAAIQEYPWKLIALGDRQRLLFDITEPEGENIERNLISSQPAVAARLEAKLKAWCATLEPPGLPTTFDRHHEGLFAEHEIIAAPPAGLPQPDGAIQGWICRNGTLAVDHGALRITPDRAAKSHPFITYSRLDIPGPVTVKLRVRAKQAGTSALTWRVRGQSDFVPKQSVAFEWPASSEWQEVQAELPIQDRLIHLRIIPAEGSSDLEVQSIELCGVNGKVQRWQFGSAPK